MQRITDIEMKVYEFLGVKKFKKLVFLLLDKLIALSKRDLSKEERRKFISYTASNYNIGKDKDLNALIIQVIYIFQWWILKALDWF